MDGIEGAECVLAGGGDLAADAAERLGGVLAAEQSGDLLLKLHHPDVTLRLIVVEGDVKVGEEGLDLGAVPVEPFKQIPRFGLLFPAASDAGGRRHEGTFEVVLFDDGLVALPEVPHLEV